MLASSSAFGFLSPDVDNVAARCLLSKHTRSVPTAMVGAICRSLGPSRTPRSSGGSFPGFEAELLVSSDAFLSCPLKKVGSVLNGHPSLSLSGEGPF